MLIKAVTWNNILLSKRALGSKIDTKATRTMFCFDVYVKTTQSPNRCFDVDLKTIHLKSTLQNVIQPRIL